MTPAARVAAAIGVLDGWCAGTPAEQALTNWGRASRFAGSGDRAAVRDLVFEAIRCRRSFAALGGAGDGRGLMLGRLRAAGEDPEAMFTGLGHAPAPLTAAEAAHLARPVELARNVALDCPDWLAPRLESALGAAFAPVMRALRHRAPVFLRVNLARATRASAAEALAAEGIGTRPAALAKTALEVTGNARRVRNSAALRDGLVELQDTASQAVVEMLPIREGARVLDFCAGGGGKSLAMAARAPGARITAHDADPGRMADLPTRAARAGARIRLAGTAPAPDAGTGWDLVLCDVPCSGSGAWRRSPEAKWTLTADRLSALVATQAEILDRAAGLVRPGGALAYVTCSLLDEENGRQIKSFLGRSPGWSWRSERRLTPLDGGDGFFCALLLRDEV
jgi:16S rRNA (cytosine967-C5)-methyltransferase